MQSRVAYKSDLEGPVSSHDNALKVCERYVSEGGRVFPLLSRYDDILALANKEGYEPGDTLKLLVPFLVGAGVTEEDIATVSAEAGLVTGIRELFDVLQKESCLVWIISTSYHQHALSIAQRVGVPLEQVCCTEFPINRIREEAGQADLIRVERVRRELAQLFHEDLDSGVIDEKLKRLLNSFFWEELPKTKLGAAMAQVSVCGGRRKVRAVECSIQYGAGGYLSDAFVVGDSITDFRMAQAVEAAGGIAVAWNGDQYIIPYASCGIAAVDARSVKPLFDAWREGGRSAARELVETMPEPENPDAGPYYHWLAGESPETYQRILAIHKRLRTICRGKETAALSG